VLRVAGFAASQSQKTKASSIRRVNARLRIQSVNRVLSLMLTMCSDLIKKLRHKEAARRLHETAQSQQGFFTTKQAIRSGFAEKTHSYHVNAGNWIREHRGICRLADFPAPERGPDALVSLVPKSARSA
jgi:hypothetical protein